MRVAIDWDDTLVDHATQEWLPGALEALRRLVRAGHHVVIHSCRANWQEGIQAVEGKLLTARLDIPLWRERGKPIADVYIDDRAMSFTDWPSIHQALKRL